MDEVHPTLFAYVALVGWPLVALYLYKRLPLDIRIGQTCLPGVGVYDAGSTALAIDAYGPHCSHHFATSESIELPPKTQIVDKRRGLARGVVTIEIAL